MCVDGIWGSICGDGWTVDSAYVTCLTLGYDGSAGTISFYMQIEYILQYVGGGGRQDKVASIIKINNNNYIAHAIQSYMAVLIKISTFKKYKWRTLSLPSPHSES